MDNQYEKFQGHILRILEPATVGDKLSKFCDYTLSILVILNLVAVTLESVPELEQKFTEALKEDSGYVTEQGDIETWKVNKTAQNNKITEEFQEYIKYLKSKLD